MQLQTIIALCLYAGAQQAVAAPVDRDNEVAARDLEARASPGESNANPIKASVNVQGQNQLPFDADCYAILCKGADRILQRDSDETNPNRKDSGVTKTFSGGSGSGPFRNPQKANVKVPAPKSSWDSGNPFVSPEEFPFASTTQGGNGAFLVPVNQASQNSQGGAINAMYEKYDIDTADCGTASWFELSFTGSLGPYCKALMAGMTSSDPICQKNAKDAVGDWGFDVGEYVYKYDGHSYRAAGKQ
ncbi:uncharacterized protein ACHE_31188A [Aspergillus chevalieri]|uniref:Deoxyribonuclease NucA/NucB domain-containing protein n=1 Tax=Aspergillus chevalieri TaxID=182096 RepID=A0A7R7ZN63_ASPCH|nr:uncharacterized protein ACHE_31188A [Aspergillus chevalieri]BCR87201.1 hypothetical protein ACHE_31188A [Aspergillus chevalieri]